ncbi:gamma-glutamyltransferase [Gemmata massiliana]|uniref:gamma-glutamyltransferase n=1 Tax=Gemmata massiliana TaxID=1210884 RepID=UPI0028F446FB|nr:gamma-glutamyltransferase [Gemmata massiliana]
MGDPSHAKVPVEQLLSDEHAKGAAEHVRSAVKAKMPLEDTSDGRPSGGAVYLNTVDASGLTVALTFTHGGYFGSQVTIDGLGLVLGHGVSRFDPRPGRANSPAPGKRPLHNMCPAVVTKDGTPVLALGATGGRRIVNACSTSSRTGSGSRSRSRTRSRRRAFIRRATPCCRSKRPGPPGGGPSQGGRVRPEDRPWCFAERPRARPDHRGTSRRRKVSHFTYRRSVMSSRIYGAAALVAVGLATGFLCATALPSQSQKPTDARPSAEPDTVFVEEMTWVEVRDAQEQEDNGHRPDRRRGGERALRCHGKAQLHPPGHDRRDRARAG